MQLRLKLEYNKRDNIDGLEELHNTLLRSSSAIKGKLSTKKIEIELDNKDETQIKSLRRVELVVGLREGFLILKGNLSCSFRRPFGGEFYVIDYLEIPNGNFDTQGGVNVYIDFDNNNPDDLETTKNNLRKISNHSDFEFNISQFDEFMEVFSFYKKLTDEINNSATYEIKDVSAPYHYLPVDVRELYDANGSLLSIYEDLIPVYDSDDIIKGYEIPIHVYERFNNSLKEKVLDLVDIEIQYEEGITRKILKMRENLYVSNHKIINEKNSKDIRDVELLNLVKDKDVLVLTVIEDKIIDEKFVNLYDMGQKIKIESIDNSLRLIRRGTTEASMTMIEYLIGDKKMPSNTPIIEYKENFFRLLENKNLSYYEYIKNLNNSQRIAFLKAIDGSPVTLIKGPPGTGKTHVINAITQYITKELKEKVIISSQTHVAIDNVLDKLMENKDLIIPNRITNRKNKYSIEEIDKTLYKTWGAQLPKHLEAINNKKLSKKILSDLKKFEGVEEINYSKSMTNDFDVIGATTTTTAISGKRGLEVLKGYNWLIIDEVSKCPITEVLRYLPYVEKIILVGDDFQLSPLLEFNKEDVKHLPSYDEDMFEKLEAIYEQSVFSKTIRKAEASGRLILLDENYRSLKTILDAYNIFYDGSLVNMREAVSPEVIQFKNSTWFNNDKNIYFIEALGATEQDDPKSHSRFNVQEAHATAKVLEKLLEDVKDPNTVTVSAIFPYAAQISYFTKNFKDLINRAKKTFKSFELDTVDAFQGRETDIVLLNTVVTRPEKRNFLRDFRRINVSMSRARDKLFVFGSRNLAKIDMESPGGGTRRYFKNIIDGINKNGVMMQIDEKGDLIRNESKRTFELA